MGVWVYESHLGGLYTEDHPVPVEYLYCAQCGDSDWNLGEFETLSDFLRYYADNICLDEARVATYLIVCFMILLTHLMIALH